MGHTNETSNYELPQFVGTDKPTWLGDINGAMLKIDAAIAGVASDATGAVSVANGAATLAESASAAASAATTTAEAASTAATSATSVANTAADTANNAQSTAVLAKSTADTASATATATDTKVGALTDLQTTVKTSVVAAINEVNDKADRGSVSVTADGVKTLGALLTELDALIDYSKITPNTTLVSDGAFAHVEFASNNGAYFLKSMMHTNRIDFEEYRVSGVSSALVVSVSTTGTTYTTDTDTVPTSGTEFTLYY